MFHITQTIQCVKHTHTQTLLIQGAENNNEIKRRKKQTTMKLCGQRDRSIITSNRLEIQMIIGDIVRERDTDKREEKVEEERERGRNIDNERKLYSFIWRVSLCHCPK